MSWVFAPSVASANDEAAHALAEKFSQAADEGARAEEARQAEARAKAEAKKQAAVAERKAAANQRAAEEAEMLRSAKEEAEARRAADLARTEAELKREAERETARAQAQLFAEEAKKLQLEQNRRAEEARQAEAARLTREVEEKRQAEERRLADEKRLAAEKAEAERKAAEARAAEDRRKAEEMRVAEIKRKAADAEEKRRAEEARVAELKRQAEAAEEKRKAEEAALAEQRRIANAAATAQRTALEAQREAEAQRIAEKFRLAREARERGKETRSSLGGPVPEAALPLIEAQASAKTTYPARVTVLVLVQPRRHGFANPKMTANPVLCVGDDCYVSNGAGAQASPMRRAQALGPGNTVGRNAGACRNHTTCVFRGVTLPAPLSTIQPVDLGFWHHERREIRTVEPDRSCDIGPGQLHCSEPIVTAGYRAWIVPETTAAKAGAQALERALDAGLPVARAASTGNWNSVVQALPTR